MFEFHGILDGFRATTAFLDHDTHGHEPGSSDFTDFHVFSPWDQHDHVDDIPVDHAIHQDHTPQEFGDPHGDGFTHQTTAFTCAVVAQKMILDEFHVLDPQTGEPISEAHLVYDAAAHGWLTDHGTSMSDIGRLLEYYGVGCHQGSGWRDVVQELADGHQVIMAVNAQDLWSKGDHMRALNQLIGHNPNHALVLKGVRIDSAGHVSIVVNDPGQEHGAGVEYPIEHFQAALDGRQFHFVATDHAPPGWEPNSACKALLHDEGGAHSDNDGVDVHPDNFSHSIENMSQEQRHSLIKAL